MIDIVPTGESLGATRHVAVLAQRCRASRAGSTRARLHPSVAARIRPRLRNALNRDWEGTFVQ